MKKSIPCFYHPTCTVLIDDEQNYLNGLMLKLSGQMTLDAFRVPEDALQKINSTNRFNPLLERVFFLNEDAEPDTVRTDVDLATIRDEVYNTNRFSVVSCCVVDYMMPNLNGLEVCQKIENPHIQKIMLTGEADQEKGLKAFNEQLVNNFCMKNNKEVHKELQKFINESKDRYFAALSAKLISNLELDHLKDREFIKYFEQILEEHGIVEYYLTDKLGGFMLLDKLAKPVWLAVCSEEDLQGFIEIAEYGDDVPKEVVEALKSGEKIPYFFSESDYAIPPNLWGQYLHPAEKIQGAQGVYYVALITESRFYELKNQGLMSYQDFFNKQ